VWGHGWTKSTLHQHDYYFGAKGLQKVLAWPLAGQGPDPSCCAAATLQSGQGQDVHINPRCTVILPVHGMLCSRAGGVGVVGGLVFCVVCRGGGPAKAVFGVYTK
jgi:hypothetical protein